MPKPERRESQRAHRVDMASLTPIAEALGADKSPKEVLELILKAAFSITRATSASLMLIDDEDNLRVEVAEGFKDKRIFQTRLKVGQGITGWVAESGVPRRLGNVKKDPLYIAVQQNLRSELAVPMKIGGRIIGVISVDSARLNHFTSEDEALLTSLAAQSARVIQSTRLYEEARRRADELELLGEVARGLSSSLDLREVLARAVELTGKVCRAEIVSVFLLNEAGTDFDMAACHGGSDEYRSQPRVPVAGSLLGRVILAGKALSFEDVQSENNGLLSLDAGVRSLLAVPLVAKESPLGVLCVFGGPRKRFDDHDLSLLENLALSSALAIDNARAHRHMLEAEETLRRAEKHSMLGELAAGLAHEIRNPLTSIKMLFGTIYKSEKFSDNAQQDAEMIVKQIARLEAIVEGFLNTARQQVAPSEMTTVDFNATVDESMLLLASSASEGTRLTIDLCDGELPVRGDATQLSQVVYNLVLNAIQAVEKRGRVSVRTKVNKAAKGAGCEAILEVADDGPGLAEKVQLKLFQPFVSTKKTGVGLGLSIVKRIVESHGGRLEVESPRRDIGRGALFRALLPAAM
ncbi:MAG TPA: GAF domain-containing protein [Planctomycetota bacterium]|nr:GAF domain-containing protein [Planctomycetota bacterium]